MRNSGSPGWSALCTAHCMMARKHERIKRKKNRCVSPPVRVWSTAVSQAAAQGMHGLVVVSVCMCVRACICVSLCTRVHI